MKMCKILSLITFLSAFGCSCEANEKELILNEMQSYVLKSSAVKEFDIQNVCIVGNIAIAKVVPKSVVTENALVFMKRENGKWVGIDLGTGFDFELLKENGISEAALKKCNF